MGLLIYLSFVILYHFWLIWAFGLVTAPVLPLLMFWKGLVEPQRAVPETIAADSPKPSGPVVAGFLAFLALYLGFMLWSEDFCYQDGHSFTEFTAIGQPRPPSIWPGVGRFWPLGYQEYNVIAHLSPTATAYLMFGAAQLLIGLRLLYDGMPRVHPTLRLATLLVLMLAPAFCADFAELTYADRNAVFGVCVLIFLIGRFDRRPTWQLLLGVIVVSYFALFYKETTAALFGGFAVTRIVLKLSRSGLRGALRSPLELGIVLACAYFAVMLGLTILPMGTLGYVHQTSVGKPMAAWRYLTGDPLLLAFLVAFGTHVVVTLRKHGKFDPLWDPLAVGAVFHMTAVTVTGLSEVYLMGPSDLVATLTLLRLGSRWWEERRDVRPILASVGAATVAVSVTFGVFRLLERKNIVWQWQKVANFVVGYYHRPEAQTTRLYLRAEGGVYMDFLSFLRYRGLRFHMLKEPAGVQAIEVVGSEPFPKGICWDYTDFLCRHDVARVGDLVVRLPEESWFPNDTGLRSGDEVLGLHDAKLDPVFQSLPALFNSPLRPLLAALYRVSPTLNGIFRHRPLPDDWLSVSASKVVPVSTATAPGN